MFLSVTSANPMYHFSVVILCMQTATEKEVERYCRTREGEAKLTRAAHKIREKAGFALQMDREAAAKGVAKMSKAEAKAQARLEIKTEFYMKNVQKVSNVAICMQCNRELFVIHDSELLISFTLDIEGGPRVQAQAGRTGRLSCSGARGDFGACREIAACGSNVSVQTIQEWAQFLLWRCVSRGRLPLGDSSRHGSGPPFFRRAIEFLRLRPFICVGRGQIPGGIGFRPRRQRDHHKIRTKHHKLPRAGIHAGEVS